MLYLLVVAKALPVLRLQRQPLSLRLGNALPGSLQLLGKRVCLSLLLVFLFGQEPLFFLAPLDLLTHRAEPVVQAFVVLFLFVEQLLQGCVQFGEFRLLLFE